MQQQNNRSLPKPDSDSPPRDAGNPSRFPELGFARATPPPGDLVPEIRQARGTGSIPKSGTFSASASASNSENIPNTSHIQWDHKVSHHDYGRTGGQSTAKATHLPSLAPRSTFSSAPSSSRQPAQLTRNPSYGQQSSHPNSHHAGGASGLHRSRSTAKRSSSRQTVPDSVMEPSPIKKPRTGASPPRMSDLPTPSSSGLAVTADQLRVEGPTSPLFFSHSASSKHVSRLAGFHQSETTAALLARVRDDSSGAVTTLKLPRANVSSPSPARSGSTPGSWGSSMDTSAPALTPDVRPLAPALQGLGGIDLIELLDQDVRPTFLVDLANPANLSRPGLHIMFYNLSLRTSHQVLRLLTFDQDDETAVTEFTNFKSWILSSNKGNEGQDLPLPPHKYGSITWTSSTLRKRFRFIGGNPPVELLRSESPGPMSETPTLLDQQGEDPTPDVPLTPEVPPADPPDYFGDARRKSTQSDGIGDEMTTDPVPDTSTGWHHPDEFTNDVLLQAQSAKPSFDWTSIPLTDNLPEHIRLARTTDWANTALGPIEDWPHELRAMSNLVMGSPHPAALYWGSQSVCLYNAAYKDLAGRKHPMLMGQEYSVAWSEIWEELEPVFQAAWDSGQATMKNDNHLFINRHGYLEETFFSWSLVPLVGADGEVVGLYNPAFENTRRKITERQMLALREIGERTVLATNMKGFWPQVQKGLEYNAYDVPFALIYSVKDDTESEASSFHSSSFHTPQLVLEGSIGVNDGHPCAIDNLDLRTSEEGFAPYMRQSMASGGMVIVLSEEDGTMPKQLIDGLDWRGFGDPCRTIVVFPVMPTTVGEAVVGFIVMGANPRRPYDDDYKLFIHLLSRQLATSMASVVLFEEEIKRGQRAARLAAMDRTELAKQLQLKSIEADESEYKFAQMAEFAPVGMFIANSQGLINYCNDMWWQISRVPPGNNENAWMNYVQDEDRPRLEEEWAKLLNEKLTISVEFRFKCSQRNGGKTIETWVLMSALPEKEPDGSLKGIFGCITDISSQKWAERVQSERREEAVELKRQQENFIDITSHEMRNPLSAILQCADQIANSISAFTKPNIREEVETLLESCLDAANTINLCASHQKRIVDDILTLSKLDSNLLNVTPVDEQPIRVIQRTLKMFEAELVANDIEFEFSVDKSFEDYGIKWARLDPSRLRQVLINLMTNAIKFTQTREKRNITVSLAASKHISEVTREGIHYFARNNDNLMATMDINNESEWGIGERINIHCSVEDSGPGLGDEELKILFQRFRQATPRTHVQYGGSGLGLFISRILTEMQGGQIGVMSEPGRGSKFCFYIQSRMCINPPMEYEHISPFRITRKIQSPASSVTGSQPHTRGTADEKGNPLYDVLIVEDNIVNQKVLQRQLRSFGNNTFVANHGKEALQTLQRSRFWLGQEEDGMDISVILMDLEMPVMDGMTCARKIRELEKEGTIIQHIPIIAVTAYARPEQIESAKAAGIVSSNHLS